MAHLKQAFYITKTINALQTKTTNSVEPVVKNNHMLKTVVKASRMRVFLQLWLSKSHSPPELGCATAQ